MHSPIDLDVKKSTKVYSNLGLLVTILIAVIGIYQTYRDVKEDIKDSAKTAILNKANSDDHFARVEETMLQADKQLALETTERFIRQEKHIENNDARLNELERKVAAADSMIAGIAINVDWIRHRIENQDRKDDRSRPAGE